MAHYCPDCFEVCTCDGEDNVWHNQPPEDCSHDCDADDEDDE